MHSWLRYDYTRTEFVDIAHRRTSSESIRSLRIPSRVKDETPKFRFRFKESIHGKRSSVMWPIPTILEIDSNEMNESERQTVGELAAWGSHERSC